MKQTSRARCAAVAVAWKLGSARLKILPKPRLPVRFVVTVACTMFQLPEAPGKLPSNCWVAEL